MPGVPNVFQPGDVAFSAEVNENFDHLSSIIGTDSTETELQPPGAIVIGPRRNTQIAALADSVAGSDTKAFAHFGWNAELVLSGSVYKFRRFASGEPATLVRVGKTGFGVHTTSRTSGDLDAQLVKTLGVTASSAGQRVYVNPAAHLQRTDGDASSIEDYRLTYVEFNVPQQIRGLGSAVGPGFYVRATTQFGVPAEALKIQIIVEIQAGSAHAGIKFYEQKSSAAVRTRSSGFSAWAPPFKEGGGEGAVRLGTGATKGQFVEEVTAPLSKVYAWVKGYWI